MLRCRLRRLFFSAKIHRLGLEQANGHRIIADMVRKRFWQLATSQEPAHMHRIEELACMRTYMMLMGFAFENIAKAILITRDHSIVSDTKLGKWPTDRGGHGFAKLIKSVLGQLPSDEENLLLRLEEYVVWAGRYPIPKSLKDYKAAKEGRRLTLAGSDVNLIEEMFSKLERLVGTYELRGPDA